MIISRRTINMNMNHPTVKIVGACDHNRVIGYENDIPWDIQTELKQFQQQTVNTSVICGRKTYENMGNLPDREIIVLSRTKKYDTIKTASGINKAINSAKFDTVSLVGGETVFNKGLNFADYIELTIIHNIFKGGTYFPTINRNRWAIQSVDDNAIDPIPFSRYTFVYNKKDYNEDFSTNYPVPGFIQQV
jgi:dihydrofolate reductase